MYYLIEDTLKSCTAAAIRGGVPYAAVLTPGEWQEERDSFEMGIDIDPDVTEEHTTKAEVNYDSVTGTFSLPYFEDDSARYRKFAFALDEKGIVFIDAGDTVQNILQKVAGTKKWRAPSLERFIYDFLEQIIAEDLPLLESYGSELDAIDKSIGDSDADLDELNRIRGHLRVLLGHYDRLLDLSQEFEENENGFFQPDNLRFFNLFSKRASRLFDTANSLLAYTIQIRDNYEAKLNNRQNHIMTILTVVTSIFMPLTLITGWYGMNFRYMPELASPYAYPAVFVVSLLIAAGCLIFFKLKKWL